MKNFIIVSILVLLSACSSDDKKPLLQDDSSFCTIQRELTEEIINRTGELIYDDFVKKYAIFYYHPGTVDGQTYYILCEKPENINLNDEVRFSGKVFKFNTDENFDPPIGGMDYRYFKPTFLEKI
ncbi:MAG TPA: hypothetical protein VFM82_11475 [Flavobacteriaceae bacterium]|nr:hypothetical protein [Flavobacteriaceae bacterium]